MAALYLQVVSIPSENRCFSIKINGKAMENHDLYTELRNDWATEHVHGEVGAPKCVDLISPEQLN